MTPYRFTAMKWRKICLNSLFKLNIFWVVILTLPGSGCRSIFAGDEKPRPVSGRWTGQLVRVPLYDHKGASYDAMELANREGPTFDDPRIGAVDIAPQSPILVSQKEFIILGIDEGLIGKRVAVRGTMHIHLVKGTPASDGSGGGTKKGTFLISRSSASQAVLAGARLHAGPGV